MTKTPYLQALFQSTDLFVGVLNPEGKLIDANEAALNFINCKLNDIKGDKFWETPWWDHSEELQEKLKELIKAAKRGETTRFEANHFSPEGDKVTVDFVLRPVEVEEGSTRLLALGRDITERKATEEELEVTNKKLKQSGERYQKYFEELGDAIFILAMGGEEHGRILDANPTAGEQTGYSQEKLVGMNMIEDLSVGTPLNMDYEEVNEKLSRGETVSFTEKKERKDGSKYWTEVVVTPIDYEGREANLSINRDITDRVEAKKKLKQSEKKFRQIFNNANDALYLHELTGEGMLGQFIEVNDIACEMLGYSKEELLSISPHDINGGTASADLPAITEELLSEGHKTFEMHHEAKDGRLIPVEVSSHVFEMNGEKRVLSIARDISERKELQRKQELVSSSLDQASLEIFWIKPDGSFAYTNKKVKERLGYSEEELADMYVWDVDPNPGHARDKRKERWTELKDKEVINFESVHQTSDGETFPVEISSHYVKYGDREYEFAFARDITERKESRRQLKKSEEKLRQSFIELAETTSRVLGVRDPYTQEHEQRVAELAEKVGKRMGLNEDKQLGLYLGGILHDIGKIAIPETILTKPGELKDVEWKMIKSHPEVGYNKILEDTNFPWPVAEMALHHHERLDGSGYPDGLEGDELSLEVRILGAVDVIEAMSTRRPYRAARSRERTLEAIKEGKGEKFDPEVVEVLVDLIDEGVIKFGEKQ